LTGAGSCTITASQDGNADYNPAGGLTHFAIAEQVNNQTLFSFTSSVYPYRKAPASCTSPSNGPETRPVQPLSITPRMTLVLADCASSNGLATARCDFDTAPGN
jgi:hypothetical protein